MKLTQMVIDLAAQQQGGPPKEVRILTRNKEGHPIILRPAKVIAGKGQGGEDVTIIEAVQDGV